MERISEMSRKYLTQCLIQCLCQVFFYFQNNHLIIYIFFEHLLYDSFPPPPQTDYVWLSQQCCKEWGSALILQLEKLWLREVKWPAWGHTVNIQLSRSWNRPSQHQSLSSFYQTEMGLSGTPTPMALCAPGWEKEKARQFWRSPNLPV